MVSHCVISCLHCNTVVIFDNTRLIQRTSDIHYTYGETIFVIHLIIIIKSEISAFALLSYFSMAVCLRRLHHHMLSVSYISLESWVLFHLLLCSLMMCTNNCIMVRWSYSFICRFHYPAIIIMQTYLKVFNLCLPGTVCPLNDSSCKIWGCVYSAYRFLLWWLWEYV